MGNSVSSRVKRFLPRTLLWWTIGYLVVTAVNAVLTLGLGLALGGAFGDRAYDVAYDRTVAAHMVVGVAVWAWSGQRVLRAAGSQAGGWLAAAVAATWVFASVLVDAVVFVGVLADTPAGAPATVFYVENQPWTTLYYLAVGAGPFLGSVWELWSARSAAPK